MLNQNFNDHMLDSQEVMQGADSTDRMLLSTYFNYGFYYLVREWLLDDLTKTPHEIADLIQKIRAITQKW